MSVSFFQTNVRDLSYMTRHVHSLLFTFLNDSQTFQSFTDLAWVITQTNFLCLTFTEPERERIHPSPRPIVSLVVDPERGVLGVHYVLTFL